VKYKEGDIRRGTPTKTFSRYGGIVTNISAGPNRKERRAALAKFRTDYGKVEFRRVKSMAKNKGLGAALRDFHKQRVRESRQARILDAVLE